MKIILRWYLGLRIKYLKNELAELKLEAAEAEKVRNRINGYWHMAHSKLHAAEERLKRL